MARRDANQELSFVVSEDMSEGPVLIIENLNHCTCDRVASGVLNKSADGAKVLKWVGMEGKIMVYLLTFVHHYIGAIGQDKVMLDRWGGGRTLVWRVLWIWYAGLNFHVIRHCTYPFQTSINW